MTISAWVNSGSTTGIGQGIVSTKRAEADTSGYVMEYYQTNVQLYWGDGASSGGGRVNTLSTIPLSTWTNVAVSLSGNSFTLYINGVSQGSYTSNVNFAAASANPLLIGRMTGGVYLFNGLMANLQMYNTSLSSSDISALYVEGIGGTPLLLQNLVAWWPLNGDAVDYGGNNYNGAAFWMAYTSQYGK